MNYKILGRFIFLSVPLAGILFLTMVKPQPSATEPSSTARRPGEQVIGPNVLTVTTYGAVGDGVTDDTASIRAALAAIRPRAHLRFPAGIYKVSSEIAVETDDVILDFEGATLVAATDNPVLRLGAGASSDRIYSGIAMSGRLTIKGAGAGKRKNACLAVRNLSYGHLAASVKITNCGGTPFLFASYQRGVQHNYVGGGWEITGNAAGAWEIRAEGRGGYINDNTFQAIRSHRNGSGGLTQARMVGEMLENNTFVSVAVETTFPTDKLLEIQNGKGNIFVGLRLDGRSGTKALEIQPVARGNIFLGLAIDGTVTDASQSSIVLSDRGSEDLPFIRLGSAGGDPGGSWDIAITRSKRHLEELTVSYTGVEKAAVRFPAKTQVLYGDREVDDAPIEINGGDKRISLRTLRSTAIGSGPAVVYDGRSSKNGDMGSPSSRQVGLGAVRLQGGRHVDEIVTFANGNTTPSISSGNTFRCSNKESTRITAFADMVDGHRFTIILDSNTTIQHGARIRLRAGESFTAKANSTISFVTYGGTAYETGRSVNG